MTLDRVLGSLAWSQSAERGGSAEGAHDRSVSYNLSNRGTRLNVLQRVCKSRLPRLDPSSQLERKRARRAERLVQDRSGLRTRICVAKSICPETTLLLPSRAHGKITALLVPADHCLYHSTNCNIPYSAGTSDVCLLAVEVHSIWQTPDTLGCVCFSPPRWDSGPDAECGAPREHMRGTVEATKAGTPISSTEDYEKLVHTLSTTASAQLNCSCRPIVFTTVSSLVLTPS